MPGGRRPGTPVVLLQVKHTAAVRAMLEANPSLSLQALCPLVQAACGLPSMNIATLSRFLTMRGFQRVMSVTGGAQCKAERVYGELLPEHLPLILSWCAGRRRAGLVRLQALIEQRLGFAVSKATLRDFLTEHGALRDARLVTPSSPAGHQVDRRIETAGGAAVRWVRNASPIGGAS